MALSFITTALTLLTAAAGHAEDSESARRLTWISEQDAIWTGGQCSHRLSPGPADADVELRIGGLPASTAGEDVHLQWWSPRKSATIYDPLTSIVGCSVHIDVLAAYPRYDDAKFNGGNVRVSESGEAVIRVQAPSTYFVWEWVAVPHIHLRLCTGASTIQSAVDAVMLRGLDPWISSGHESNMTILSVGPYAGRSGPATAGSNEPRPYAYIESVEFFDLNPSTTTMPITSTMPVEDAERGVQISIARDNLDLDALEFSPVYTCLLNQKFFDHFGSACATDCPEDSAVAHGQCVRGETADPPAEVSVSWTLGISCGNPCWHNKKNVTLHNVRLSVAGHLDIPFQEVEVSTGFALATSRRLTESRTAVLTVTVLSNRISATEATTLMGSYAQDAAAMSTLLGLNVDSVSLGHPGNQNNLEDTTNMGQNNDPYVPAYDAIEKGPNNGGGITSSVVSMLPTEAIIGIAIGIVVLAVLFGSLLFLRRRRQRRAQAEAQQAQKVDNKVAETEADTAPAKPSCV